MPKKRELLHICLFTLVILIDQYTKWLVTALDQSREIFGWLSFTYVRNTGLLWGKLQGTNTLLIWASIAAFAALLYYHKEFRTDMERMSHALLLAGIWGNLIDRLLRGFVVDFIDLGWWPVFNIADSAIVVGISLYVLEQLRK